MTDHASIGSPAEIGTDDIVDLPSPGTSGDRPGRRERHESLVRLGDPDTLGTYLREIGRFSLLTAEQEIALAKRIEAGRQACEQLPGSTSSTRRHLERSKRDGESARHQMIEANLRLVVSVARRYRWSGVPLLDLIQEGNIGLMRGVDKYEWRKGFKFSTYATWWIRQAIQRGIADRGRTIRLPVHIHDLLGQVTRARTELENELGRQPTQEEVAASVRVPLARVQELDGFATHLLSLETPLGDSGDATLGDRVRDETAGGLFEDVLAGVARDEARNVLSTLNERERVILALRFGFSGEEPLTLEEVGKRFGLTRERIRQIEAKALAKLRHPSRSSMLRVDMS